jgi:hypothetical protein
MFPGITLLPSYINGSLMYTSSASFSLIISQLEDGIQPKS